MCPSSGQSVFVDTEKFLLQIPPNSSPATPRPLETDIEWRSGPRLAPHDRPAFRDRSTALLSLGFLRQAIHRRVYTSWHLEDAVATLTRYPRRKRVRG